MDTKRFFLIKNILDFPDDIELPEIEETIQIKFKKLVRFTEELQCIDQLFELFIFNLNQMGNFCTMYYNDRIIRKSDNKTATFIEVNGFLINIISSGKSLTDNLEKFLREEISTDRCETFRQKYSSKKYDEVFAYALLSYLRNYSQHGYLPVSMQLDNRFCFDLSQIINTIHIHPSASIRNYMKVIYDKILNQFNSEPTVAFTATLDLYTLTVMEIYYCFLKDIENDILTYHNDLVQIIAAHPEIIIPEMGNLRNIIVYDIEQNTLQMFSANDNLWNWFVDCKEKAKKELNYYKKIHLDPATISQAPNNQA